MYEGYKGLNVYQKSYGLVMKIYQITKRMPDDERYVMTTQMRRAAMSIPLNISEGYGKKESTAEYRRFLMIAKGSCNEIQVLIDICKDLEYITNEEYEELIIGYTETSKMLQGLVKSIT